MHAPQHDNCKHGDGEHHSCLYTDARNRLIPEATHLAEQRVRASGEAAGAFNREFFAAMDELARARGVVGDGLVTMAAA